MNVRRRTHTEPVLVAGRRATLVARTWTVDVGRRRRWGYEWTYTQPRRIQVDGPRPAGRAIHDYVMLARVAGIAILTIAALTRRISHD